MARLLRMGMSSPGGIGGAAESAGAVMGLPQDRQLDRPPLAVPVRRGSCRRAGVNDLPRAAAFAAVTREQREAHLDLVLDRLLRQAGVQAQPLAGGGLGAALLAELAVPDVSRALGFDVADGGEVPADFHV